MSHLDEGTLHALLDGELDGHEVAEIQAHLGACSSCGLRLREVKEFLSEADRLIASVNLDASATPPAPRLTPMPAAPVAGSASPRVEPETLEAAVRPQPPTQAAKWEPWNEPPPPVLLIPENESAAEKRMRRMRRLGWAAIVLVIAGAGWVEARKMMPVGPLPADSATPKAAAVVSPEETVRPDSTSPAASAPNGFSRGADSTSGPTALAARKPAAPRPSATTGAVRTAKPVRPASTVKDTEAKALATRDAASADSTAAENADSGVNTDSAQRADQPDTNEAANPGTEDVATVRARASQALADLDRERRVKQAAAATAALDAQKRRPQSAPVTVARSAPAAAPTPATLEQRARIYLRIGLDEASRQLAGPAHVIEGLSPLFMGLVQGTGVAGADAGRPVVRVVYQDSQGRLILLDQQRLRSGQTPPPATALSWTIGATAIWLNGEAPTDVLRTYRSRVR
ncbi:MAG: zf-HC2 domain-containing protein [Gemmatimonadales bacterium]